MSEPLWDRTLDEPVVGKWGIPRDVEATVVAELRPGERLLWVGQPIPKVLARQHWGWGVFGGLWTAFSLAAMVVGLRKLAVGEIRDVFNEAMFVPPIFLLIGLLIVCIPFWMRRAAKRTVYAISDRRAILWKPTWSGGLEIRSIGPDLLGGFYRVEYPDGGDLILLEDRMLHESEDGYRVSKDSRGFMGIADVRRVEELLRGMLARWEESNGRP